MEFRETLRQVREELAALRTWRESVDARVNLVETQVNKHSTAVAVVLWMGGALIALIGAVAAITK